MLQQFLLKNDFLFIKGKDREKRTGHGIMLSVSRNSNFLIGHFNKLPYTDFHESVAPCRPAFRMLSLLPLATALPRD
jgi:hypothetical protein